MKGNNNKKKIIHKVKDSEISVTNEDIKPSNDALISVSQKISVEAISTNKNNNKQEKTIINICMSENEEMVYSAMGLDPILLLEEPPASENYIVNIIKPGEEAEKGKAEIKNNQNTIHLENQNPTEQHSTITQATEHLKGEGSNVDVDVDLDLDEEKNELISADEISINETNDLNSSETKEADEDPRRKRRRSSAAS